METSYVIIGDGRVARHFSHYLSLLGIAYQQWSRAQHSVSALLPLLEQRANILLLISDDAIEAFIRQYPILTRQCCVHFSGSLVTPFAYAAHPLMTFGEDLYTLIEYQDIPWVVEKNKMDFKDLLPGLPNTSFSIDAHQKDFYHAMCVLSNNFTTLLWQKFIDEMGGTFQIPKSSVIPILQRTVRNIIADHAGALTGPLVRQDQNTIDKHLLALRGDDFEGVYHAFIDAFKKRGGNENTGF